MSDQEGHATPSIWSHFNVPTFLLGPAGAAFSKLLGKATEIPIAHLDARVQSIKDQTTARSTVSDALAHAIGQQAIKDPAIMGRAMQSFVAQEFRKQENKEAVAQKTAQ